MALNRFIDAQKHSYDEALREIKSGRKRNHWMWYIFPQIKGLGYSSTAQHYAIQNRKEAEDYIADPILGLRLREITRALLELESSNADEVFGFPDNMKLKSSMTLFCLVSQEDLFQCVLDKFFCGELDEKTVELLMN